MDEELNKITKEEEKKAEKIGKTTGAIAGGTLGVVLSNPLGRFLVLNAQDQVGINLYEFLREHLNKTTAKAIFNVYSIISNAIIAYPAILPIAGGIIVAGVGALIGKKIAKSRLKHQSLQPVKAKEKIR